MVTPRESLLIEAVERDGFAIVPSVLRPETVSALRDALAALRAGSHPGALDRAGAVYGGRNLLADAPLAREVAQGPELRSLVAPWLGPRAFPVRGLFFDKSAEANWMVPWHQDLTIAVASRREAPGFRAWTRKAGVDHVQPPPAVLEGMLTVRLHLDDCGPGEGPLQVVPGSHRGGRLDLAKILDRLRQSPPVTCLVPAGGALLMRPLLLHASSSAETPTRRRVIHLEFAAAPLPGGLDWFEHIPTP